MFKNKFCKVLSVLLLTTFYVVCSEPEVTKCGCSNKPSKPNRPKTKKDEMVEIKESGLKIEIKVNGKSDSKCVKSGDTAVVDYTGWLLKEDGSRSEKPFDSSKKPGRQAFEFIVGRNTVIQGWEQGVLGMKPGETRELTIPYQLAYGERGVPGVIPAKSTLIFEVELKDIK